MVGCGVGVLLWVFSCLVKCPGISLFGRYGYPHVSVSVACKGVFVVGLDEVGEISSMGGGVVASSSSAAVCVAKEGGVVSLVLVVVVSGVTLCGGLGGCVGLRLGLCGLCRNSYTFGSAFGRW